MEKTRIITINKKENMEKQNAEQGEKVFFFHTPGKYKQLHRYTIAGKLLGDGCIHLAASKCSKRDQFNKSMGRTIALGRLNSIKEHVKTKWCAAMPLELGEGKQGLGKGFVDAAIKFIRDLDPSWREVIIEKEKRETPWL